MNGLIFDDATCEMIRPPAPPVPRVRDYLYVADYELPSPTLPTMGAIKKAVVEYYGLAPFEMISARRSAWIALPRQLAMYLCREMTLRSLAEIGRGFGGRDHSTVIHAIRVVKARLENDPDFRADHDAIVEALHPCKIAGKNEQA